MKGNIWLLVLAACAGIDDGRRIDVAQENGLGIAGLVTERSEVNGNKTFMLHALSATDQELASVRLTTGLIAGLSQVAPGQGDLGSEITVSVGGKDLRVMTREMKEFHFDATLSRDTAVREFLALDAVSSVLAKEAKLSVIQPKAAAETPYTNTCAPSLLNTSPRANQCCWDGDATMFSRSSDNAIVSRIHNSTYWTCTASDGVSSCSGDACYFGPNGFARANFTAPWDTYPWITGEGGGTSSCEGTFWYEDPPHEFGDVDGSFPTGQTCPGGGSSAAWDY